MEPNSPFIDEWAGYLASQLAEGLQAYIFCHTPDELIAPSLCRELHRRISNQIPLAPLPWDETDKDVYGQGRLF
jgi:hypothetical protein